MKKIILAIFAVLIIISVAIGYYFKQDKALNGNNEDSIKKYFICFLSVVSYTPSLPVV
ncbi:hypothetical protein [Metaclostridioides mangenotii]|uniref:hypothetical protein n=1 Tax=Metaclostridioides mangenotii TaxID=1540 RepID=UPI000A6CE7A2|nr:hypothetical protein [Clostridioides mangenotii]